MDEVSGDSGTTAAPAASAPVSPTGTPDGAAASVASPRETPTPDGSTSTAAQGPIPYERHKAILEKARQDAERMAWAKDLNPEQVRTWRERNDLIERDPLRFKAAFEDYLAKHPVYSRYTQAAPAATEDPEPQPDLQAENGMPVYSAQQQRQWQEWQTRRLRAEFEERLRPFEESRTQQQARDEAVTHAKRVINDLMALPHAPELRPRIVEIMKTDGRATPQSAYRKAFDEWEAGYEARVRKAYVDEMNQKVNATTGNPNTPSVQATSLRDKPWEEVLAHFDKR